METKSVRVAVIGAGMAGLVAARELQRENHDVVIFEKSDRIGGLWVFDNCSETDTLGLDPTRQIVHSSMYDTLRTYLPRHLMGFLDYPFTSKEGGGDSRTFPGREEVVRFLNDFATDFDLVKLIRFDSTVVRIEQEIDGENISWTVESRIWGADAPTVEVFEAVVVCNGHNTQPRIADFPGRSTWPGIQVHSHNHRYPQSFTDQIVVIIGNGTSALEISNDILPYAKEVHQATRTRITADQDPEKLRFKNSASIMQHPMIKCAEEDGKIVFEDGSSLYADVILHCTGYNYDFPFLRTNDIVTVDDNRVGPLYKHIFAARAADTLSFIGLTYLDTPPLVMELQSKWVARVLSRKMFTSSEEYMMLLLEQEYAEIEELGWPKHHTHRLQMDLVGYATQFGYEKWLNDLLFLDPLEKWREEMFFTLLTLPTKYGLNYRDEWDADKWLQEFEQQELSNNNNN